MGGRKAPFYSGILACICASSGVITEAVSATAGQMLGMCEVQLVLMLDEHERIQVFPR